VQQVAGVALVASGVALASAPPGGQLSAALLGPGDLKYAAICVASFAFPSLAVIIKQQIFADARKRLGGRELDVLVVNALGSAAQVGALAASALHARQRTRRAAQESGGPHACVLPAKPPLPSPPKAVCVVALLPLLTAARGLPLEALPGVLAAGAAALVGAPTAPGAPPPPGAPLFPVAYVIANVAFNISALTLVRATSAVTAGVTLAAMTPLAVLAFTLPLPLLAPAALGPCFWAGLGVLMAGLWLYNRGGPAKAGSSGGGGKGA
jgi:hypothetical protein